MLRNLLTFIFCSATAVSASAQCNELFFSEYLEGTSNNKAIEIYNASSATVNLTDYVIYRYNNGSPTPTDSLHPQGTLAAGAVWVAGNPSAVADILNVSDTLHSITFFNGDDAMSLKNKVTGVVLDIIGIIGNDPGTNWPVGTGATSEFTIVRNAGIQQGNTNWTVAATEYDVYPQNTYTYIGNHTMNPCVAPVNPVVSFATFAQNITEGNTTVTVTVNIQRNGGNLPVSADIVLGSATTATGGGVDYTYNATTLTWAANDSTAQTVTITVVDDAIVEPTEVVELTITNLTGNAITLASNYTLNIQDNDFATYPIGTINTVDANGVGDSLAVKCWVHGVVYGVNQRPAGLQFTIIDPTGGIGIFNSAAFPGYTVLESDSIHVLGTINQFNGLLQIDPDSIVLISTGNTLKEATTITTLGEAHESDLVQVVGVWLTNPSQWTGTGSGFNVDVTDGINTTQIRIDNDVDLYSQPAPTGILVIRGIGGQFDSSNPYTEGYQLLPRYQADIIQIFDLDLGADQAICAGDSVTLDAGLGDTYAWSNGATTQTTTVNAAGTYTVTVSNTEFGISTSDTIVITTTPAPTAAFTANQTSGFAFNFQDNSTGATSWAWNFGDGNTSTTQNPSHTYTTPGSYTVSLTVTGACGTATTDTIVIAFVGVKDPVLAGISLYPNPSQGQINVRFEESIGQTAILNITDLVGRTISSETLINLVPGSTHTLNISSNGVYMVEVKSELGTYHSRVIVR